MSADQNKTVDWNAPIFNRKYSISSAALFMLSFLAHWTLLLCVISECKEFIVNVVDPDDVPLPEDFGRC